MKLQTIFPLLAAGVASVVMTINIDTAQAEILKFNFYSTSSPESSSKITLNNSVTTPRQLSGQPNVSTSYRKLASNDGADDSDFLPFILPVTHEQNLDNLIGTFLLALLVVKYPKKHSEKVLKNE